MPNIASFIVYVIVTSITPGPNNIMSMSNASKYGFKKGLPFNFGVLFGFLGVLVCCTLFSSLLYNAIPKIEPIMRYFGAAYILWLAWSIFNEHKKEGKKSLETNNILTGAVLQFVNVKVIIYSITVMSTFVLPYYKDIWSIILFIIILAIIGFSSTCVWALFGSIFERVFREKKKLVNIIMALLLVYCAATIIITH